MTKDEIKLVMQWCLPLDTTSKKLDELVETFANEHKEAINYSQCCTQLLCLNTHETWDITEGKIYDKEGENQREYIITNDKGKRAKYFKRHFEEVQN